MNKTVIKKVISTFLIIALIIGEPSYGLSPESRFAAQPLNTNAVDISTGVSSITETLEKDASFIFVAMWIASVMDEWIDKFENERLKSAL